MRKLSEIIEEKERREKFFSKVFSAKRTKTLGQIAPNNSYRLLNPSRTKLIDLKDYIDEEDAGFFVTQADYGCSVLNCFNQNRELRKFPMPTKEIAHMITALYYEGYLGFFFDQGYTFVFDLRDLSVEELKEIRDNRSVFSLRELRVEKDWTDDNELFFQRGASVGVEKTHFKADYR